MILLLCCAAAPSEAAQQLQGANRGLALGAAAILVAQAALIAGLLVHRRRRRRAEEQLSRHEAELRASYNRIRNIGGRLLTAQEAERSRIARELHDDISQQLALLEIGMRESGSSQEMLDRVSDIARSVHELSHRLHPAKLRLLGLLPSVHALVREQSRAGIAVSFTHRDVPAELPESVTLCLFRAVQETLQNAVKHSHATKVTVDLHRERAVLALTIADDGVGFDPDDAWGMGLGLISIRERVEASRGTFAIQSTRGAGTRCDIRVPLAVEPGASSSALQPEASTVERWTVSAEAAVRTTQAVSRADRRRSGWGLSLQS